MISYAQNAEDVVLARALPDPVGFYVDVGAGDPDVASVTKHFYDHGWHGINIDPRADAFERLQESRTRDVNIRAAAGDTDGTITLFVCEEDPDLSTTDPDDKQHLIDSGHTGHDEQVALCTLNTLLGQHGVEKIDFLKIDAEGSEHSVLRGLDLGRWRPRVIVVEAVKPWSHTRQDGEWRDLLSVAGYRAVLFDGINLFLAQEDDQQVIDALVPASVLDDFKTAGHVLMEQEIERLRAYVVSLESEVRAHKAHLSKVESYVSSLEESLGITAQERSPLQPRGSGSPSGPSRPPGPARLAVIGTPGSAPPWLGNVLADCLGVEGIRIDHPADIPWSTLPQEYMIELAWPRTTRLQKALSSSGTRVISIARHPIDSLLGLVRMDSQDLIGVHEALNIPFDRKSWETLADSPAALAQWATSPSAQALLSLTSQWWTLPSTIRSRYEALVSDPVQEIGALVTECGLDVKESISETVSAWAVSAGHDLGELRRRELDDRTIVDLLEHYEPLLSELGYK